MSGLQIRLPGWAYGAVLLLVLAGVGMLHQRAVGDAQGRAAVQELWDADKKARAATAGAAVAKRLNENAAIAVQQAATLAAIKKAYDEEIDSVRTRIAAAERMRLPAFCASAGPAATASADGAEGGAAADSASGLLPEEVAGNIKTLILETEEAAAIGRACQSFIRVNIGRRVR